MKDYINRANQWLNDFFDIITRKRIKYLMDNDIEELKRCFTGDLIFGTGGIRSIMDVGTNRLNKYTLTRIILGFSNFIIKKHKNPSILIGYDIRDNSYYFAKLCANVLSSFNIKVFIFKISVPTPLLSFSIKYINCDYGIMITASHNPWNYNGCKIYNSYGSQIVYPHDKYILEEINNINSYKNKYYINNSLIHYLDDKLINKYINTCLKYYDFGSNKDKIKIVFSSLHGTSIYVTPLLFNKDGFSDFNKLEIQCNPDGKFGNLKSPNPEDVQSYELSIKYAKNIRADVIIVNDPDSDRLGVCSNIKYGIYDEYKILNGNQINLILTYFLLKKLKVKGLLSNKKYIIFTIVTSDAFLDLANYFKINFHTVIPGFKWISDFINKNEFNKKNFVAGFEESHGFMSFDFVGDKDGISSSLLITQIASIEKNNKRTLIDNLIDIYYNIGYIYLEDLYTIDISHYNNIQAIFDKLYNFKNDILNEPLYKILYLKHSYALYLNNNKKVKINYPTSNIIIFYTINGTKICCRPSGTEPKIKIYFSLKHKFDNKNDYLEIIHKLNNKMHKLNIFLKEDVLDI